MAASQSPEGISVQDEFRRTEGATFIWDLTTNEIYLMYRKSPEYSIHGSPFSICLSLQREALDICIFKSGVRRVPYLGYQLLCLSEDGNLVLHSYHQGWDFNKLPSMFNISDPDVLESVRTQKFLRIIATFYQVEFEFESDVSNITPVKPETIQGMDNLALNLKDMFLKQDCGDFTIIVKGTEFRVHKDILASRTPVLSAMLQSDMIEKSSNSAVIMDSEPEIFKLFLTFLYCGQVDDLNCANAIQLYILGDKYDVPNLRRLCVDFIESNMCPQSFYETFVFALRHDIEKLKLKAECIFVKNAEAILRTPEWSSLMQENPMACTDLFLQYVLDFKPRYHLSSFLLGPITRKRKRT